jgi:hypothetical protein
LCGYGKNKSADTDKKNKKSWQIAEYGKKFFCGNGIVKKKKRKKKRKKKIH